MTLDIRVGPEWANHQISSWWPIFIMGYIITNQNCKIHFSKYCRYLGNFAGFWETKTAKMTNVRWSYLLFFFNSMLLVFYRMKFLYQSLIGFNLAYPTIAAKLLSIIAIICKRNYGKMKTLRWLYLLGFFFNSILLRFFYMMVDGVPINSSHWIQLSSPKNCR